MPAGRYVRGNVYHQSSVSTWGRMFNGSIKERQLEFSLLQPWAFQGPATWFAPALFATVRLIQIIRIICKRVVMLDRSL